MSFYLNSIIAKKSIDAILNRLESNSNTSNTSIHEEKHIDLNKRRKRRLSSSSSSLCSLDIRNNSDVNNKDNLIVKIAPLNIDSFGKLTNNSELNDSNIRSIDIIMYG